MSVHPFYTTAEVLIGGIAIEYSQYAERLDNDEAETYQGQVLTAYDDQVAISIGSKVDAQPGSYYAVYQNVVEFGDHALFLEQVGSIIVSDVETNGRLSYVMPIPYGARLPCSFRLWR